MRIRASSWRVGKAADAQTWPSLKSRLTPKVLDASLEYSGFTAC
jgi:hypothetical protein